MAGIVRAEDRVDDQPKQERPHEELVEVVDERRGMISQLGVSVVPEERVGDNHRRLVPDGRQPGVKSITVGGVGSLKITLPARSWWMSW